MVRALLPLVLDGYLAYTLTPFVGDGNLRSIAQQKLTDIGGKG